MLQGSQFKLSTLHSKHQRSPNPAISHHPHGQGPVPGSASHTCMRHPVPLASLLHSGLAPCSPFSTFPSGSGLFPWGARPPGALDGSGSEARVSPKPQSHPHFPGITVHGFPPSFYPGPWGSQSLGHTSPEKPHQSPSPVALRESVFPLTDSCPLWARGSHKGVSTPWHTSALHPS